MHNPKSCPCPLHAELSPWPKSIAIAIAIAINCSLSFSLTEKRMQGDGTPDLEPQFGIVTNTSLPCLGKNLGLWVQLETQQLESKVNSCMEGNLQPHSVLPQIQIHTINLYFSMFCYKDKAS